MTDEIDGIVQVVNQVVDQLDVTILNSQIQEIALPLRIRDQVDLSLDHVLQGIDIAMRGQLFQIRQQGPSTRKFLVVLGFPHGSRYHKGWSETTIMIWIGSIGIRHDDGLGGMGGSHGLKMDKDIGIIAAL